MSVFIDTSALCPVLVRIEADHRAMTHAFRDAAERARRLVTTNYVLIEIAALLQHRIGLELVRDLETRLAPLLDVIWVTADVHRRALERLFRLNRRQVSLVDAVRFTVMDGEAITEVLALDANFASEGLLLVP